MRADLLECPARLFHGQISICHGRIILYPGHESTYSPFIAPRANKYRVSTHTAPNGDASISSSCQSNNEPQDIGGQRVPEGEISKAFSRSVSHSGIKRPAAESELTATFLRRGPRKVAFQITAGLTYVYTITTTGQERVEEEL